MTQKDKIRESFMFAVRAKNIADNILSEGNSYDMQWHKSYCRQLMNACDDIIKKLK